MDLSKRQKTLIFSSVVLACLVAGPLLYWAGAMTAYAFWLFALITGIVPLGASFYVYKGRLAKFSFVLACLAAFCGLIIIVNLSATNHLFSSVCQQLDKGAFAYAVDFSFGFQDCIKGETVLFHVESTDPVGQTAMWLALPIFLFSFLHLFYLPIHLLARKIAERK